MIRKTLLTLFVMISLGLITSCSSAPVSPTPQANMPNPASVYCQDHSGQSKIVTASDGSQSGICTFPDNSTCDEWAYFRGECKPGDSLSNKTVIQATYQDPFDYCAAVGTIDAPDAGYTGPQITDEIINGYKTAAGLQASTEPTEMFKKATIWRCMDKQVYACNFGANLPCDSKADTNRTPTSAMGDYCKANPNSDFIPMSVTGHTTIYSWHCVNDAPEVLNRIAQVDATGYLANIWYLIKPGTASASDLTSTSSSSSTNMQVLFSSNRGGSYADLYLLDTTSLTVTRLTNGDSNTFAGPFSPDGSHILFTGFGLTHSYVGMLNVDGSGQIDLTNQPNSDEAFPAWSPDGKQIAFTSRRDGNNEIYIMNADGSNPKRLTNNPEDDFAPAWSPDGTQIAFVSDRDNQTGINSLYVMNSDGTAVKRLTNAQRNDYAPAWSPDGTQIVYQSVRNGQADIYVIDIESTAETNLTNNPADDYAPCWSPDGKQIAFQTKRDGNWEIYVMNVDGSNLVNLTQNPAEDQLPYWKP